MKRSFINVLSVIVNCIVIMVFSGQVNEKLRARLKETSFTEAETLAQRIVRHDEETIDMVKDII